MSQHWYALNVRSRSEVSATQYLRCSGYEIFRPTYRDMRRWSDRVKELDVPFFPGYAFCFMDIKLRLPVLQAPGVLSVVSFGSEFVPVPEVQLDAVRTVVNSIPFARPCPYLNIGEPVVITRGPLSGIEGELIEIRNEVNLIVSVHLLQRSVSVKVELADVKAKRPKFNIPAIIAAETRESGRKVA